MTRKQPTSDKKMRKARHRRVFEHVQEAILAGEFQAGQKLPTDAQLMRRFDISRPTVARAMRDLEQLGLIERRPGSGSYVRMANATSITTLGLLIPGLGGTEIFEPICGELARVCEKNHFNLIWGGHPVQEGREQEEQAEALCRRYINQQVAGVFFSPMELSSNKDRINHRIAESLDHAGIAVVLLDRDFEEYPQRSKFDLVGIDNVRAGFLQAKHFLDLGCRRIDYFARPMSAPTVDARIAGYQLALKRHGIPAEDAWVHRGEPDNVQFVRQVADERPEAILCANDITAANLMRTLIRLGLQVPNDIRVMGLDDVKYAQLLAVPLTTLHQPCREIGVAAVTAMVERLEHRNRAPRDILLNAQLVVRESCGKPSSTKPELT